MSAEANETRIGGPEESSPWYMPVGVDTETDGEQNNDEEGFAQAVPRRTGPFHSPFHSVT